MPKGSVIFLQGDTAAEFYVVYKGSVTGLFSNPDGRELVVDEIRAGRFFGELALLTDQPRSMSLIAREKCELILVPRAAFAALLEDEPRLARNLLKALAERLYRSAERERALAFMDAPARLAQLLLQLNDQASDIGYITVSQEELARRTGLTRQTVAKNLGRWRRSGWLLTGRGKIVLLNLKALQDVEGQ
jgi:CRP-like cAMP-binding protein